MSDNTLTEEFAPMGPPEVGLAIWQANAQAWGQRRLWPFLAGLERMLCVDARAASRFDALIHQSVASRSGTLVEALKACLKDNAAITSVIQQVAPGLKDDRLERLELTRTGDQPGVQAGQEVIVRVVQETVRPRG